MPTGLPFVSLSQTEYQIELNVYVSHEWPFFIGFILLQFIYFFCWDRHSFSQWSVRSAHARARTHTHTAIAMEIFEKMVAVLVSNFEVDFQNIFGK